MSDQNHRQFWIIGDECNEVWEYTPKPPMDNMIHVIEYSAVEFTNRICDAAIDEAEKISAELKAERAKNQRLVRSDSEEGQKYTGRLQHCAGLLIMMVKDDELLCRPQVRAHLVDKRWDPEKMDKNAPVYTSLIKMLKSYIKMYNEKYPDKKIESRS